MLGVATLGYYIDAAFSEIRYDVAMTLIVATALLSMSVDALSRSLRRHLRLENIPSRLSEAPSSETETRRLACRA